LRRSVLVCLVILLGLFAAADAVADRLINCEVTVREKTADSDQYILIAKDDIQIREGLKTTSFHVNFTLDLTVVFNDSGFFDCGFSVYTVGSDAQRFFKTFTSQPGGVYFLERVRGKAGSFYRIGISPLSVDSTAVTSDDCQFDYRGEGAWSYDPSANFDLYFVPGTLADARWNMLRDFLEINNKSFKKMYQLSFPGKVNCFLAPCVLPEVIWDKRMGYAIDPPRSNAFMLYSHDYNTVDPFPAYLTRIYRFLGYAPPLLAEGMAAYFEFPHFYAHELMKSDQLPPLNMLLTTQDYYSIPDQNNVSAASSFVKYLIDVHGLNQFMKVYKQATDLTIQATLESVYEKPLADLESEWLQVLDTVQFDFGHFQYYYERERFIQRKHGMELFLGEMWKTMDSFDDSTMVMFEYGWNKYMDGDYAEARKAYETLLKLEPTNTTHMIVYGNLLLIDGRYDSARVFYDKILAIDTTEKNALYKIGESYYWQDNVDSARYYLLRDVAEDHSQISQAASAILLGEMALAAKDTAAATDYYTQAVAFMNQIYTYGKTRPSYLLRLGQANLGLTLCGEGKLAEAKSFLESALYFEAHPTRVIFVTRILQELGRIADLQGDHDKAVTYYQEALKYPLPPGMEQQIRESIVTPFTGF